MYQVRICQWGSVDSLGLKSQNWERARFAKPFAKPWAGFQFSRSEVVLAGRDRVGFPFHCRNAPFFCWYNATLYNNRAFILVPDSSHKLEKNDKLVVPWLHISAYVVVAGSWRAHVRSVQSRSRSWSRDRDRAA